MSLCHSYMNETIVWKTEVWEIPEWTASEVGWWGRIGHLMVQFKCEQSYWCLNNVDKICQELQRCVCFSHKYSSLFPSRDRGLKWNVTAPLCVQGSMVGCMSVCLSVCLCVCARTCVCLKCLYIFYFSTFTLTPHKQDSDCSIWMPLAYDSSQPIRIQI